MSFGKLAEMTPKKKFVKKSEKKVKKLNKK